MTLRVTVVLAFPRRQEVIELELAEGATVADAIAAARQDARFAELEREEVDAGIWSRPCPVTTALRDGDRVEIYRALQADAKAQRRARARLRTSSTRSRSGR